MSWRQVGDVAAALREEGYIGDARLHTTLLIASILEQPLLLEGEAGVGKTEVARAVAAARGSR